MRHLDLPETVIRELANPLVFVSLINYAVYHARLRPRTLRFDAGVSPTTRIEMIGHPDSPNARVALTLDAVQRQGSGAIVGPIWIANGALGAAFPEVGWADFPVALLAAWLPAFRRLATRGQTAECHFMDGPYHFTVTAAMRGDWTVACFERREGPKASNAIAEWTTTPSEFVGSAVAAGRRILGHCDARGWWDPDTDDLRAALTAMDLDAAS